MTDKALSSLTSIGTLANGDTGTTLYAVHGANSRKVTLGPHVPSLAGGFLQAGDGAVTRFYINKNRWRIDAEDYGATGDGSNDDTAAIQAAIDHVNSVGGGEVRFEAAEYSHTGLIEKTGVRLVGKGSNNTILKLRTNANAPVIKTLNFDTLLGGSTTGGPSDFGIIGITLDGNRSNQSGAADSINGLSIYGYRFLIEDVVARECKGHGWRSDWGTFGEFPMEATIRRLKIDTCGRHGFRFGGPHDSYGEDIIVVDASQELDDGYDGVLFDSNSNGRWINLHSWHRSTVTNRMLSAARVETGGNEFIAPHFEGGRQCLIQRGDRNVYKAANIYAGFSTDPMVVIRGSHVFFEARIEDTVPSGASCLQVGESGTGGLFFSHLDVTCITAATNAVVISEDDGKNTGIIKTTSATNAYSGSWSGDSSVLVQKPDGTYEERGTVDHSIGVRTFASNVGVGTTSPDRRLHSEVDDSTNNAVTYAQRLTHTTSGTPANGIGVGLEFEVETGSNNNEVGATIEAVTEDVTSTSEDFSIVFKTMLAGAAAEEVFGVGLRRTFAASVNAPAAHGTAVLQCLSNMTLGASSGAGIQAHSASLPNAADLRVGFYTFGMFDTASRNGAAIVGVSDAAWTSGSDHPTRIGFETAPDGSATRVERARIAAAGNIYFPGAGTTASAANAVLNSGSSPANELLRSTSSLKYKREVEPIDASCSEAILNLQPIWYRSKCKGDNPEWSWYGLAAEDVAAVDPRLVHWGYQDDAWETVLIDEPDGSQRAERRLKPDAKKVPDGVTYDRLTVLLLDLVKRLSQRVQALEARA